MEDPIYYKIDYEYALSAKKQLLSSEASILKIMQRVTEYKRLRSQEMILKTRIKNQLRTARLSLKRIFTEMPEIDKKEIQHIPHIHSQRGLLIKKTATVREKRKSESIERQLAEIHERLRSLEK